MAKERALEHQLVLARHLIDVEQRQAALLDARHGQRQPLVALVALEGRAVDHQQQLGAALLQRLGGVGRPHVLADHEAETHAAEGDRARRRTGGEDALLVEDAVIRQIAFEAQSRDLAAIEQRRRVVALAVLQPGRADDDGGAARRLAGEIAHGRLAGGDESGLQHEVLGRIPRDAELGCHDEIGAEPRPLLARAPEPRDVAGNVAHRGIDLGQRDGEVVHGSDQSSVLSRQLSASGCSTN